VRTILLVAAAALLAGAPAGAQDRAPDEPRGAVARTLLFLAGGAGGLVAHEAGHILVGAALGARPHIRSLDYGPIPFFAIEHEPVGARQEFAIAAAGFWMQHATSEWILTTRPDLRRTSAPFRKGVFVFHLATSALYTGAALGRIGPPERDTLGMAGALGRHGIDEPVIGLLVIAPAALDAYRYLRPDSTWARWASRGAKIAAVSLVLAAGSSR
jgi:hypothetical protein